MNRNSLTKDITPSPECATPNCTRPSRWLSITEANKLGSDAPRRCVQCCDAIDAAMRTFLAARVEANKRNDSV